MYKVAHDRIKQLVHTDSVIITVHAEEEMDDDEISTDDILKIMLYDEITERQKDRTTGERKYLLKGLKIGLPIETVVKISLTNKVVVITVYAI